MRFLEKLVNCIWEKGYTDILHQKIANEINKSFLLENKIINNYLDLGSVHLSSYSKITDLFNTSHSFTSDINLPKDISHKNHIVCNFNKQFLPFSDNTFDLVNCTNVIEHLFDTDIFLLEVKRILRRGGFFIIATNNISCWTNILSLIFGRQPNTNHISDYGDFGRFLQKDYILAEKTFLHRRIFSLFGLEKILKFHGFKILAAKSFVFYPFSGCIEKVFEKFFRNYCAYIVFLVSK